MSDAGARTLVLSFVDLRFQDGHVERWIGPGFVRGFPADAGVMGVLKEWAEEVAELQMPCLRKEVEWSFSGVVRKDYDGLPVQVVVEWGHVLDLGFEDEDEDELEPPIV